MGFFSWKTSDTKKSISNCYSKRGPLPVYLITPQNDKIFEPKYEGYGIFNGYDAYALLAKWNAPEKCNGDVEHDRLIGIYLDCSKKPIKYPLKFTENPNVEYNHLPPAAKCEYQGYFYTDE